MNAYRQTALPLLLGLLLAAPRPCMAAQDILTPSLALKEEYTDNLFFSQDKEGDFITTLSPALRLAKATDRLNTTLTARIDAAAYNRNTELNALDQALQGKIAYQTSPLLKLALDGSYDKDSRTDRDLTTTGFIVGTSTRQQQQYGVSGNFTLSETTAALLAYRYEKSDLDNPRLVSYLGHNLNGGLNRDLGIYSPNSSGSLNFAYSQYQFSGVDEQLYRAMLGAQKSLSELWQLRGEVGPNLTHIDYLLIDRSSDELGTVGSLSLTYSGETAQGTLGLSQEQSKGASDISGTSDRTALTLSLERKFTDDLRASLQAGYTLNQTNRAQFFGQDLERVTLKLSPRLSYQLTQDLSLEGSYSYDTVEDKVAESTMARNLFLLRLTAQKPLWD